MDKDVETLVQVLRQSRDFFKILVDSCPCGMALTDDKGNVLVGNVALAKLLKIPVTNLKKVNLLQIFKLPEKIFLLLKVNVFFVYADKVLSKLFTLKLFDSTFLGSKTLVLHPAKNKKGIINKYII